MRKNKIGDILFGLLLLGFILSKLTGCGQARQPPYAISQHTGTAVAQETDASSAVQERDIMNTENTQSNTVIIEIGLDKLKIHPKNVRQSYEGIEELTASIKENGILQNLTVVPDPGDEGLYFVVIGNRRLTAAREAGLTSAPCRIASGAWDLTEKAVS